MCLKLMNFSFWFVNFVIVYDVKSIFVRYIVILIIVNMIMMRLKRCYVFLKNVFLCFMICMMK